MRLSNLLLLFCIVLGAAAAHGGTAALSYKTQTLEVDGQRHAVRIPEGYRLDLLTDALDRPRILTFADNGDLFIGSRSGKVYRLAPPYDRPGTLISMGGYPHSVAFRPGEILIARTDGVLRAPYRPGQASLERNSISPLAPLPGGGGHSSRTVRVGPDGRVYLSLGITDNCSDEYLDSSYPFQDRRGGVLVLNEAGGKARWEAFASGLRNPVGFDWHPATGDMYASNNGPDHLGFQEPREYFSRLTPGSFHGMPWFQLQDDQIKRDPCINSAPPRPKRDVTRPVATFPARNAPMAVAFVPDGAMDEQLEHDAIVALRGSWGTWPSGSAGGLKASRRPPAIVVVRFEDGQARRVDELVTGFQLAGGSRWARPVGVAVGPDGALYFTSDSGANALFRLSRSSE